MVKKRKLFVCLFIFVLVCFAATTIAYANPIEVNLQKSQNNVFAFFKSIIWYIWGILLIILFVVKQTAHGQGNESGEQKAKMGMWGITITAVGIQWGQEIYETVKGWFV